MEIRLNHTLCHTPEEAKAVAGNEVAAFLEEWCSPQDTVTGHTSGSTGVPKKISLLKSDMVASARLTNNFFKINASSIMLLCLSPSYIAGKMMLVRAMLSGADLVTVKPSSSPLSVVEDSFDFAAMVPMQVQESLNHDVTRERIGRIKFLIIGGASVSSALEKQLASLPVACYATYGMTETVSHIALRRLSSGTAGYKALGDVTFSQDERNCLIINAPHLNQKKFVTNDVVRLSDARHFEWLGRYDNVINSGGVKLYPEKIEQTLSPFISSRFFLTSQPDERLGEMLVLVIEGQPWTDDRMRWLNECIAESLTSYRRPRKILFRPHFRETYSGKVIRKIDNANQ